MSIVVRKQTLSVPEVAGILGVSPGLIYKQVADGEIKAIHIGRKVVITRLVVEELLGHPLPD